MSHEDDLKLLQSVPGGPSFDAVRTRLASRRRNRRLGVGAVVAVAAVALGTVMLTGSDGSRLRGAETTPRLELGAVADGPRGARPLPSGAEVGPNERVVFDVDVDGPGTLSLTEDGVVIWQWGAVDAGTHVVGGASAQAWRPDRALQTATYEATLCPQSGRCASSRIVLRWR